MTSRSMARRTRTAVAALALSGLALGAAACGGDDDASGHAGASDSFAPGASVDVATIKQMFSDAMASASTVHVDMTMTGTVAMSGSGDMDMAAKPAEASLHLTSSSLGGDITMLMVDKAMYLRSPMFGTKYVKVAIDDASSPVSQMGLDSLDPTAMFDRFGDAVTGGTYVGPETRAGTETEHYRFTLDAKALATDTPGGAGKAAAATPTMDVWFDEDGRYHTMAMKLGDETVTETFSEWGEPVDVEAPPAAQVQDMSGLMSGGAGKTAP